MQNETWDGILCMCVCHISFVEELYMPTPLQFSQELAMGFQFFGPKAFGVRQPGLSFGMVMGPCTSIYWISFDMWEFAYMCNCILVSGL